jgi:hypothetical protein
VNRCDEDRCDGGIIEEGLGHINVSEAGKRMEEWRI